MEGKLELINFSHLIIITSSAHAHRPKIVMTAGVANIAPYAKQVGQSCSSLPYVTVAFFLLVSRLSMAPGAGLELTAETK